MNGDVKVYNTDPARNENLVQAEVVVNLSNIMRSKHVKLMTDGTGPFSQYLSPKLWPQLKQLPSLGGSYSKIRVVQKCLQCYVREQTR